MKNFLSIIAISLLCFTAAAQVNSPVQQMPGKVRALKGDTITNTGTVYDSIVLNLSYNAASIEVQCTKISGTLGGILKVQALNKMTATPSWTTLSDTATVTNTSGTKSYFFRLPGAAQANNAGTLKNNVPYFLDFYVYRILWTGTGTMSGSMKSYFVGRHL